jgi:predicted acylesterase/phospholipase RssA
MRHPAGFGSQPVIGLALGSGGIRGCAHVGALEALESHHLAVGCLAGCSVGALIGAFYTLGTTPAAIAALGLGPRLRACVRLAISRTGILDPAPLAEMVGDLLGRTRFEDTRLPFAVSVLDLANDERITIRDGPMAPAVAASMMIPGLFPPWVLNGRAVSDPGSIDPVPVDVVAKLGADLVIAVSAGRDPGRFAGCFLPRKAPWRWGIAAAATMLGAVGAVTGLPVAGYAGRALRRIGHGPATYPRPTNLIWVQPEFGGMSANAFSRCELARHQGRLAIEAALPRIRTALGSR